jgi:hypothetical protein
LLFPGGIFGQLREKEMKEIEESVCETERLEAAWRAEGACTAKPNSDAMIPPSIATEWHKQVRLKNTVIDVLAKKKVGGISLDSRIGEIERSLQIPG